MQRELHMFLRELHGKLHRVVYTANHGDLFGKQQSSTVSQYTDQFIFSALEKLRKQERLIARHSYRFESVRR